VLVVFDYANKRVTENTLTYSHFSISILFLGVNKIENLNYRNHRIIFYSLTQKAQKAQIRIMIDLCPDSPIQTASVVPTILPYDLNTSRSEGANADEFHSYLSFDRIRSLSEPAFEQDQLAGFDILSNEFVYSELYDQAMVEETFSNVHMMFDNVGDIDNADNEDDCQSFTTLSTETLELDERQFDFEHEHEHDELPTMTAEEHTEHDEHTEQDPTAEDPETMERNELLKWLSNDDNITERMIDVDYSTEYCINIQHQFMDSHPHTEDGEPMNEDDPDMIPETHILVYDTPYSPIWLNIYNIDLTDERDPFEDRDKISTEILKYLKTAAETGNFMYIDYPERYSTLERTRERSYWLKLPSMKNTAVMMEMLAQSSRRQRRHGEYYRHLIGETAVSIAWDIHHSIGEIPAVFEHISKTWFYQYPSFNNSDTESSESSSSETSETSDTDETSDSDSSSDNESVISVQSH